MESAPKGIAVTAAAHLHKQLYAGSKAFWRTRETVDLRILGKCHGEGGRNKFK